GSNGATVNISGGTVTATGGTTGAGIGGGTSSGGTTTITGGQVTATGNGGGAGIGGRNHGKGGTTTITGGQVTATGNEGGPGIGAGKSGSDQGSFATGTDGHAVIIANSILGTDSLTASELDGTNGIFFLNSDTGALKTDSVTVTTAGESIPTDKTLVIESGQTLSIADGTAFTNNGTIYCLGDDPDGSYGKTAGSIAGNQPYYQVTATDCTAAPGVTYNSRNFAQKGQSVTATSTLTSCFWKHPGLEDADITGCDEQSISFTMPGNPVKVKALSATVTLVGDSFTYDGNAKTPSVTVKLADETTLTEGTDYTVPSYDNNVNAGTATVTVTGKGEYSGVIKKEFTIAKKELTVNASVKDKVYDGTVNAEFEADPTISGVIPGDKVILNYVTPSFSDKNVGDDKAISFSPDFSISGKDAGNYSIAQPEVRAKITKKPVSVTDAAVKNKTYDGTTVAEINKAALVGVVGDDKVSLDYAAAFADKNAGTNKDVTFSKWELKGQDKDNYELTTDEPENAKADITRASLSISGTAVSQTKIYDGTAAANITDPGHLNGVISDDNVTIKTGSASYDNKNAGTGKTVTFSDFELEGTDAGNYSLAEQPERTTADITKRQVSVTNAAVRNKIYDGTTVAEIIDAALVGVVGDDKVSLDYAAAFADKNAGTDKAVTFSKWELKDQDKDNYELPAKPENAKADITKAPLTATYLGDSITFGETPKYEVQVTGFVNGETAETADDYTAPAIADLDKPDVTNNAKISATLTPSGGSAKNYYFNYIGGTFAMNIRTYTVTFLVSLPSSNLSID
ncbi:MAG: YDG domain-containing protein, partial [Anaerovoracaceae bacterium]|nr:YDG domain-containing protein [Anaerovoracaceae bacterium]